MGFDWDLLELGNGHKAFTDSLGSPKASGHFFTWGANPLFASPPPDNPESARGATVPYLSQAVAFHLSDGSERGATRAAQVQHNVLLDLQRAGIFRAIPPDHRAVSLEWLFDPRLIIPPKASSKIVKEAVLRELELLTIRCRNGDDGLLRHAINLFELHSIHWKNSTVALMVGTSLARLAISDALYREAVVMLRQMGKKFLSDKKVSKEDRRFFRWEIKRIILNARFNIESPLHFEALFTQSLTVHRRLKSVGHRLYPGDRTWDNLIAKSAQGIIRNTFRMCFKSLALSIRLRIPWSDFRQCLDDLRTHGRSKNPFDIAIYFDTGARYFLVDAMTNANDAGRMLLLAGRAREEVMSAKGRIGLAKAAEERILATIRKGNKPTRSGLYLDVTTNLTLCCACAIQAKLAPVMIANGAFQVAKASLENTEQKVSRDRMHHIRQFYTQLEIEVAEADQRLSHKFYREFKGFER